MGDRFGAIDGDAPHLSFPCFFRSQHNNQSWVAAFTAVLDVCALLIAYGEGETKWQAQLTFAISRHAVADLAEVLRVRSRSPLPDRLPPGDLPKVRSFLVECGVPSGTEMGDLKLKELREMYEPHLQGLSRLLWMPLPSWGIECTAHRKPTMWDRIVSPGGAPPFGETELRSLLTSLWREGRPLLSRAFEPRELPSAAPLQIALFQSTGQLQCGIFRPRKLFGLCANRLRCCR